MTDIEKIEQMWSRCVSLLRDRERTGKTAAQCIDEAVPPTFVSYLAVRRMFEFRLLHQKGESTK